MNEQKTTTVVTKEKKPKTYKYKDVFDGEMTKSTKEKVIKQKKTV